MTLAKTIRTGDPDAVASLIAAGADIRYRDKNGYDALIDAVHGRDVLRDPRLLELLELLVSHGVELSGIARFHVTLLPDGRTVLVGGEHEDWYDPDFCIYNDVIVHEPDGSIRIFGYPESDFPPTDFHTATLVGGAIHIIGCLGYPPDRESQTPVFRLDLDTFRIERLVPKGESPGWIHRHRADRISDDEILVSGGLVEISPGGKSSLAGNDRSWILNLARMSWRAA